MYFWSSQARRVLPIPPGPATETSRTRRSRPVAWNRSLSRRSSSSRPTNGASRVSRAVAAAAFRDHPQGTEGRDGARLALELLPTGGLEGDRACGCALRRLAHEDRARGGDRLEPRRGVHEVARHHPLAGGSQGDRGLAGQDPGPGGDGRPQHPDRVDELEARPDSPLGVVLVRDRCAPDRHDRVADELLDRAPVAADHVGREVEVAGQELPRVLHVASLGERGEAHEIGEQDRDQAALGERCGGGRGARGERCPAAPAEPLAGLGGCAAPRAPGDQRRPALGAEPSPGPVVRSTLGAGHAGSHPQLGLMRSVADFRGLGGPRRTARPRDRPRAISPAWRSRRGLSSPRTASPPDASPG